MRASTVLGGIAVGATIITSAAAASSTSQEPCAVVSSLVANIATPTIPVQKAIDCLNSVQVRPDDAIQVVDGLTAYLEWQSTLTYLKTPPEGYPFPPVDVLGSMQAIRENVTSNVYDSEFAFQLDIQNVFESTHDGHLYWPSDVFGPFVFVRPLLLASVSEDGMALPSVYVLNDILNQRNSSIQPSPITEIDGQDVVSFLESIVLDINMMDLDALYNQATYSFAQSVAPQTNLGQFTLGMLNLSSTTSLTFKNNTKIDLDNIAYVQGDFSGIDTAEKYYDKFCSSHKSSYPASGSQGLSVLQTLLPATQYPSPATQKSNQPVQAYFLNDTGFTDVCVLACNSFEAFYPAEFQSGVQSALQTCQNAHKSKLVIDLQANGGGIYNLGTDMFKQLFPKIEPYVGGNWRAQEALNIFGQQEQSLLNTTETNEPGNETALSEDAGYEIFNFKTDLTENLTAFDSWADVYGPNQIYGDNFTALSRFNYSDPETSFINGGFWVTGYGNRTNFTIQPYAAEDIIMLTDGYCASTCALFLELMKVQGKVKSIVFGGRPQTGPMQVTGGVKGSHDATFNEIYTVKQEIYAGATNTQQSQWNLTSLGNMTDYPLRRSSMPPESAGNFNARNNIRINDTSFTPLQFVYDAADCRLWYTTKMLTDVSEVWRQGAIAAFQNNSMCVNGSTFQPSSLSGNATLNGTAPSPTPSSKPSGTASPPTPPTTSTPANAAIAYGAGWGSMAVGGLVVLLSLA